MNRSLDSSIKKVEERARADGAGALADATKLIEQHPGEPSAWSVRAYVQARAGNIVSALSDVTRAIELSPSEPVLFFDRGRYHLRLKNFALAIEDFDRGIALCDRLEDDYYRESFHFLRADALLRVGNKTAALADLAHVRDDFSLWTTELRTKQGLLSECV